MKGQKIASLLIAAGCALIATPGFCSGGSAVYNYAINWPGDGDLYYTISGAPASTCGDLWVTRNGGAYQKTAAWVCTDATGYALKGPWTYASQTHDETAYSYIQWPDGSTTNTAEHIWNLSCPTSTVTSGTGSPPTSFSGTASDGAWSAGFNSFWSSCYSYFVDTTTGKSWSPSAGAYSLTGYPSVPCLISGMPATSVTWSQPGIPPSAAHSAGDCYQWTAYVTSGGCGSVTNSRSFCK